MHKFILVWLQTVIYFVSFFNNNHTISCKLFFSAFKTQKVQWNLTLHRIVYIHSHSMLLYKWVPPSFLCFRGGKIIFDFKLLHSPTYSTLFKTLFLTESLVYIFTDSYNTNINVRYVTSSYLLEDMYCTCMHI